MAPGDSKNCPASKDHIIPFDGITCSVWNRNVHVKVWTGLECVRKHHMKELYLFLRTHTRLQTTTEAPIHSWLNILTDMILYFTFAASFEQQIFLSVLSLISNLPLHGSTFS